MKARVTGFLRFAAFLAVFFARSAILLLVGASVGAMCVHFATTYQIRTSTIVWFLAGLVVGIFVHEAGHALCCLVARIQIHRIVIGSGPLLLGRRIGGTQIELRLLPLHGLVHFASPFPSRRLAIALVTVGGVLGNIVFVVVAAALAAVDALPYDAHAPFSAIVVAQLFLVAMNLVPFTAKVGNRRVATDGLTLLTLIFWPVLGSRRSARFYAAEVARYRDQPDEQWTPSAASPRIAFLVCRVDGWSHQLVRREIQQALIAELEGGALPREEEMLVLDRMLTIALVSGDAEWRPRLDEWSRRALELGPEIKTLAATRGGVLIELGHYEAGKAILVPMLDAQGDAADALFDRLMTQYFLARAERALGIAPAAHALAAAARKTAEAMPGPPEVQVLMDRLAAELK